MNKTVLAVLAGAGGAIVGSVTTYILMKKKFENDMELQLESVRKEFDNYMKNEDTKTSEKTAEEEKKVDKLVQDAVQAERERIQKKVQDLNYSATPSKKGPYLIERGGEEFGGYMAVSLEYYSDRVLVDGNDIIDDNDADEIVGLGNLALLSNERPCIWVRNEARRVDYEIAYIDEDYYPSEE